MFNKHQLSGEILVYFYINCTMFIIIACSIYIQNGITFEIDPIFNMKLIYLENK